MDHRSRALRRVSTPSVPSIPSSSISPRGLDSRKTLRLSADSFCRIVNTALHPNLSVLSFTDRSSASRDERKNRVCSSSISSSSSAALEPFGVSTAESSSTYFKAIGPSKQIELVHFAQRRVSYVRLPFPTLVPCNEFHRRARRRRSQNLTPRGAVSRVEFLHSAARD